MICLMPTAMPRCVPTKSNWRVEAPQISRFKLARLNTAGTVLTKAADQNVERGLPVLK